MTTCKPYQALLRGADLEIAVQFVNYRERAAQTHTRAPPVGHTLIDMAPGQREPNVVVLGGGSWGTTVASICARRGPTLQWVRSEETAADINKNHHDRNSRYLGNDVELSHTLRATTDFSEAAESAPTSS